MELAKPFKLFEFYGVSINKEENGHGIADCPFCKKHNHFYINKKTQCWDCKVCGEAENEYGFLEKIFNNSLLPENSKYYSALSLERKLPKEVLSRFKISYNKGYYLLPYYNEFDKVCNIGAFRLGGKIFKAPRLPLSIFNLQKLYDIDKSNEPIYLCEGEFDVIALEYVLDKLGKPGIVLGVPGSGTFKIDWIDYFHNKVVYICYDNDTAGLKGCLKVAEYIKPVAKELKYLIWPKGTKEGYDIRDLVITGLNSDLNYAYFTLQSNLSNLSPLDHINEVESKKNSSAETTSSNTEVEDIVLYEDVISEFRKWLEIDDNFEDAIKLTLACAISPRIPGPDPLWLFLVGPPGCGKSAILTTLKEAKKYTEFQSTLSSTALISGWTGRKGTGFDPSLIPKLNNKCLVLKDFTEILKKNSLERDTIFSILRGAYDGNCERTFGQGTKREYKSLFSIVAGVTREIYASSTANVGERFLKYNMLPRNLDNYDRQEMAMESALFGGENHSAVVNKVTNFLNNNFDVSKEGIKSLFPDWFRKRIKPLATLIATIRTQVIRYEKGMLQYEPIYKPQPESGNRLSVQFQRLGIALALVENKPIDEAIYSLIKKVALYTVNDYTIDILKSLIAQDQPINLKSMEKITGLSFTTVKMYVEDMLLLDMLTKTVTIVNGKPDVTYMIKSHIKQMYLEAKL